MHGKWQRLLNALQWLAVLHVPEDAPDDSYELLGGQRISLGCIRRAQYALAEAQRHDETGRPGKPNGDMLHKEVQ